MIGPTTKQISIFETEKGRFVSIEEYATLTTPLTAAPTISPTRRVELGLFDPAMAAQICAVLRRAAPVAPGRHDDARDDLFGCRFRVISVC